MVKSFTLPVLLLTCATACGASPDPVAQASPGVLDCGNDVHQRFVISAINRTLEAHPEFASYAGLNHVSSCAEATRAATAYREYEPQHAGFDAEDGKDAYPGPGEVEFPSDQVQKIAGGTVPQSIGQWYPVVRLVDNSDPSKVGICSGTMIAKNWILTAAHCLIKDDPRISDDAAVALDLWGFQRWTIQWADATGNPDPARQLTLSALQIPHPAYKGLPFGTHDLALLFLDPWSNDAQLPGRVDEGAAMRLSLRDPTSSDVLIGSGWGPPLPEVHETTIRSPYVNGSLIQSNIVETSPLHIPPGNQATFCIGDSGGPAFTRNPNRPSAPPILFGVDADALPPAGSNCTQVGEIEAWTAVTTYLPFIDHTVNEWQVGEFHCIPGHSPSAVVDEYLECWGKQCYTDSGCPKGNFCYGGGGGNGNYGQCIPVRK